MRLDELADDADADELEEMVAAAIERPRAMRRETRRVLRHLRRCVRERRARLSWTPPPAWAPSPASSAPSVISISQATVVEQPPDGSCLFHSLRYELLRCSVPSSPAKTIDLRKQIAYWIGEHPNTPLHPDGDCPLKSWIDLDCGLSTAEYAKKMARTGWGGDLEMAACSQKYGIDINVWQACAGGYKCTSSFAAPPASTTGGGVGSRTANLLYLPDDVHYHVLLVETEASVFLETAAAAAEAGAVAAEVEALGAAAGAAAAEAAAGPPHSLELEEDLEFLEEEDYSSGVEEVAHDSGARPKKKRLLSPIQQRRKGRRAVCQELDLEYIVTSGHNFNCLAFSILIVTEVIGPTLAEQAAAHDRSDAERRMTHEAVCGAIPSEATMVQGSHDVWWVGQTLDSLQGIFDGYGFMNEAHVHGFVNRLDREIVVVDVRSELLSMHHYRPGYAPQQQIPMRRALELRSQVAPRVLWLLMSPSHWSALLPH